MAKPKSMKLFDTLYLASVAVGLLGLILNYGALQDQASAELAANGLESPGSGVLIVGILFGVAINVALWFLISVLRIGFVRWILALFIAWGVVSTISTLATGAASGMMLPIGIVSTLLSIAALYFVFQPDATAWLNAKRDGNDTMGDDL